MITGRHTTKIISGIMAAAVLGCFLAMMFPREFAAALGGSALVMRYQEEMFDTDHIMQIDILMEEAEWEDMLANASAEEYYSCDVVINGQQVNHIGIRPKGNTSLSAIVQDPDTDRYSLKLEFDHYIDGQTCLGLDKLILNNNFADATNMKEAVIYDMYQYLGADASMYNYAEISVNGVYWGVYLALEAVEDSFLLRNYGAEDGALYKPENMGGGGSFDGADFGFRNGNRQEAGLGDRENGGIGLPGMGEGEGFGFPEDGEGERTGFPGDRENDGIGFPGSGEGEGFGFPGDGESEGFGLPGMGEGGGFGFPGDGESEGFDLPGMGEGEGFGFPGNGETEGTASRGGGGRAPGGGGPSMTGNGSDLNYTDDDLDSYSAIWEGEVNGTGKNDHIIVVNSLKQVSEGTELETCLDIDNILKYMAVHTFAVNMDSLSGNMAHNYYLYEYNGKLNIIPWDYNLSFGGMSMGTADSAEEMVNYAIDTPFQGTDFFDALLEDEEYLSRYHEYMRVLAAEYVQGGRFEEVYSRIRSQIDTLVKTDPTAFYSYEEYDAGAEMLRQTVLLRAESILGQLDGTIPSTDAGQRLDASGLVDTSHIDVETMGVFQMGGQRFQFNGVEVSFSEDKDGTVQESTDSEPEKDAAEPRMQENSGQGEAVGENAIPVINGNTPPDFRPTAAGMSGMPEGIGNREAAVQAAVICAASLAAAIVSLIAVTRYRRISG